MPTKETIKKIIDEQKPVSFSYGRKGGRKVEIYLLGTNKSTEVEQVRAYQLNSEQTNSGKKGWKIFNLSDIKSLRKLTDSRKFKMRKDFNENDSDIKNEHSLKK